MASLFQNFYAGAMPKRLLRYALSYAIGDWLELDLENLDFALGRNTVLEFRDVGVKLKKLERLLKLPPAFRIHRAKVLLLRVTIPIDFYQSPIVVEIEAVDIGLQVLSSENADRSTRLSKGSKPPEEGQAVPSAVDLAQSFLKTETRAEKKKLEEALAAETQDLAASISVASDDGSSSEDDAQFGTGQPLSLPQFLSNFILGVVDRMQIKIGGITAQLDVEVPVEAVSAAPEPVTFQIALGSVSLEGVTSPDQSPAGEEGPEIVYKEGKRLLSLDRVRACLITEANVFSALARSPSSSSPAVSQTQSFTERNSPSPRASSVSQSMHASYHSDPDEAFDGNYPLQDSEDAFNIPYDFGSQPEEPEEEADESPATPRASIYHDFGHAPHFGFAHSHSHSEHGEHDHDRAPWSDPEPRSHSEPAPHTAAFGIQSSRLRPATPEDLARSGSASSSNSNSSHGSVEEDLTKSRLFTHEEAASMYMSAFSHAPDQSESRRPSMPGAWDETPSPESSPKAIKAEKRESPPPPPVVETKQPLEFEDDEAADSPTRDDPLPPAAKSPELKAEDSTVMPEPSQLLLEDQPEPTSPTQQDDIPTPRGPTRLVKEILSLDKVSVYVPAAQGMIQVPPGASVADLTGTTAGLEKSIRPQLPGAFSVYSAAAASSHRVPQPLLDALHHKVDNSIEIVLSPVEVQFDSSLGFLLAMVVSKLLGALKADGLESKPATTPGAAKLTETEESTIPDIKVTAQKIALHFIQHLRGMADTPSRIFEPTALQAQPEILLKAVAENLDVSFNALSSGSETSVNVEKFRFGYDNEDILKFDQGIDLAASMKETLRPMGTDISMKISQAPNAIQTHIETRPLHIAVDLQRIDETFSWFGGLSSFLNMGASMTSSANPSPKPPPPPTPKSRGVRFNTPMDPNDKSLSSTNKMNMRIGGCTLDLIGKECTVGLETTAVKLISREGVIGASITKMRLHGPHLKHSSGKPPITAEVQGTRLEFMPGPKDGDLDELLELVVPSKVKFDKDNDDIMVDTLLKQRTRGPVMRLTVDNVDVKVGQIPRLGCLPALGEEVARLGTVAKYLPEDDRPGLLTLGTIHSLATTVDIGSKIGVLNASLKEFALAHITIPSLVALAAGSVSVTRNQREELVGSFATKDRPASHKAPVLRARMIGDVIEPIVNLRLQDMNVEYRVPTIMDVMGLGQDTTPQEFEASLAASVANLGEQANTALGGRNAQGLRRRPSSAESKPLTVDIQFGDCLLGLNPLGLPAKLLVVLTDAHLAVTVPKDIDAKAVLDINKASLLLTDDVSISEASDTQMTSRRRFTGSSSQLVNELCNRGYVNICYISSARATVNLKPGEEEGEKLFDVELRDDLLVLETCADSTQTLIALGNALKPPTPPSRELKYRTTVVPVQDMLSSISAEAFGRAEGDYDFDNDFAIAQELGGEEDMFEDSREVSQLEVQSQFYGDPLGAGEALFDASSSSMLDAGTGRQSRHQPQDDGVLLPSFGMSSSTGNVSSSSSDLVIQENYFAPKADDRNTAFIWNSTKNSYDRAPHSLVERSPFKVAIRDVHVIWNLFDGYDWARTRDVITKAVRDVETKAYERRAERRRSTFEEDLDDEETIGDFLFNSIYIGIPANRDPTSLAQAINQELNDNTTETESVVTTAYTTTTGRTGGAHRPKAKKLRLNRSKHHKITFELKGINVDLIAFPPGSGETLTSIDVRVQNLDIFDHVPTSTWKKFATYDQDAGEREMGTSMVHLELLNVQPVPELTASEMVLRATVLPLRLHVDQDALDFVTRFFEFKDEAAPPVHASPADVPFLQRAEVRDVPVRLDFKPKRVDYAGLRSGHTTEFMNFVVLDEARLVLRHTIIYGVSGFDRLGKTLNDIWMPDVKRTQLPTVLAGLAPVRSLVNVGSGFRDLIEIPIREYRRDGRIVRGIGKGAYAFARTTGTELVKLGAKVAVGTQYVLQGAEGMLAPPAPGEGGSGPREDDEDGDPDEARKQISLYADQPTGVVQGLRGGYASLTRDLNVARDAIIAVPAEVMESASAQGAAAAVLRRAPTIIFRPAIGATKAIGQTLMGATNSLDPENRRRVDEKYKKH